jgi:hypothetical protein
MISALRTTAVVALVTTISSTALAQTSLKDVARENNGTATSVITQEWPQLSWEQMVTQSDLIIRARVYGAKPRLSDDESLVYTDYQVRLIEIIKGAQSLTVSQKPAAIPPVVIQQVGGSIVVDGLRLRTQSDLDEATSRLTRGGEYVFFLGRLIPSSSTLRSAEGTYALIAGPYAAFSIEKGRVLHFSKEAAQRQTLLAEDAELFLSKLRQLASSK